MISGLSGERLRRNGYICPTSAGKRPPVFTLNTADMKNYRIEAAILAVGLALAGLFVYLGFGTFAQRDRVVSVRGLAEREVDADHVIWPITYKTTGNDLQALYAEINTKNLAITAFLKQNGLKDSEISVAAPQIVDLKADRYSNQERIVERYNVTSTLTVSSGQVALARRLMARMGELLKQGIAIAANDYGNTVQYEFNSLNKIKPAMIEEATRNAREAARKFASDSESELGKIKNATQGLFSIDNRDQYTPYIKRVRVVTSVDYYLES